MRIDTLQMIQDAAAKQILYLPHTIRQMSKPERMISIDDIRYVIEHGKIIEDYPEDARGHSCLMLGISDYRAIHVVCAPKAEYLAIITAYLPHPETWIHDFTRRA
jgi:hypothetical protein